MTLLGLYGDSRAGSIPKVKPYLAGPSRAYYTIAMASEENPVILSQDQSSDNEKPGDFIPQELSFEAVLDATCERLREKHIQYSIRRIKEMDTELMTLEKELDEFLGPGSMTLKVRGFGTNHD